jgi:hypothetical protein
MDLGARNRRTSEFIRPFALPGLSTCLQERRLCREGVPIPLSSLDFEAICLAEWALARKRSLVLCPADPLAPLSALVAASIHVADMTTRYRATGAVLGSSRRVAVVTSDYHARGFYRGLGIRNPQGGMPLLRDVVPAATSGRDGVLRVIGDVGRGWSTAFVSTLADVSALGRVDALVVELPVADQNQLLDVRIPMIVVARDPSEPLLDQLADRIPLFAWSLNDVASLSGSDALTPRLERRARNGGCQIVALHSEATCENGALFWQDVGALLRASRASVIARELARMAFSLFHDLVGLAVPLDKYEAFTSPIRVRLAAIDSAARLTRGDARELYLPMISAELRDLASGIGPVPPKCNALRTHIATLLDDRANVMLVARTAEQARLYTLDFASNPALAPLRVVSLSQLSEQSPADVAILTGPAPAWARWIYRAGIASRVDVLAYTPTGPVDAVARGFDEVAIVRRVLELQSKREEWFGRREARERVWSALSGEPVTAQRRTDETSNLVAVPAVRVTSHEPADVPPGLWDCDNWFNTLESSRPVASAPNRTQRDVNEVASAVRVTFDNGSTTLLESTAAVTRFKPVSAAVDAGYPVAQLKRGDQIVFVDGDSRKDLLSKVLEVAETVPALAVAAGWVTHWRRILASAYERFGTYESFATSLRRLGCSVQTQTIRLWVIGVTIGPDDDEDVRRVGAVAQDAALTTHFAEVCRAMRSLRGAHVRLGKRVSELALTVGSAAAAGRVASDEVIDERSGLTAADFVDSVCILTVESVQHVGDVPAGLLGRLLDNSLEGELRV